LKKQSQLDRLKRGIVFHRKVQFNWKRESEGISTAEKQCNKPSGKKGRIDIHVKFDEGDRLTSCIEIKNTDWDRIIESRIQTNVRKQANQLWDYIESELIKKNDVSPGIVFPKKPKTVQKLKLIEALFEERGISVVWINESILDRRKR